MTEAEWLAATDPTPLLKFLEGKVSDRKLRLLAIASCRRVFDLLVDNRSRAVVEVAEQFADGNASKSVLVKARGAAYRATCTISRKRWEESFSPLAAQAAELTATLKNSYIFVLKSCESVRREACSAGRSEGVQLSEEKAKQVRLVHDIFGNPFRPITLNPFWLTSTVLALANGIYSEKVFDRMPILAGALQDAGCDNEDILKHCRQPGEHVKGCWVVDLLLAKS